MKTTFVLDESVMRRLRAEAARQNRSLSDLVEAAIRLLLAKTKDSPSLSPLPDFDGGGALVDVSDRDALYQAMEGR